MVVRMHGLMFALLLSAFPAYGQEAQQDLTPEENFKRASDFIEERRDFFSALPYLRAAADAGIVRAQVWLAEFLDYGEENEEAEKYFRMAVAQGDPQAKLGLAVMHLAGDTANPDAEDARRLITEAANEGFRPAVLVLASAYISGGLGLDESVRQSPEALVWINRAAELDDLPALRRLEELHRLGGLGVSIDVARADEIRRKINHLSGVADKQESGRRRRK
jgi:TPR repeat protein